MRERIRRNARGAVKSRPPAREDQDGERRDRPRTESPDVQSRDFDSSALTPRTALLLQQTIGNHAVARLLADTQQRSASTIQREIAFARFQRLGKLSNWGSYSDDEQGILDLAKRTEELLEGLASHQQDRRFGKKIVALDQEFQDVDGKTYAQTDYPSLTKKLRQIFYTGDGLSAKIAARDVRQDRELDRLLAGSFAVVDEKAKKTAPNQITAKELAEVKALLEGIFRDEKSNLNIEVHAPFATFDLSTRATSLGLTVPSEFLPLELQIKSLGQQALAITDEELDPLLTEKSQIQKGPPEDKEQRLKKVNAEIETVRAKRDALETKADALKEEYNALIEEMVKGEVLKDLVKIAQTDVGRDLLKETAKTSLERDAKKITIRAYDQFVAATAGQGKEKNDQPYVNYTPQYFRDRDTKQREPEGAITKATKLAETNPWQEDTRTDIGLFHELVHTQHYQSGTAKTDNTLVTAEDAVHPVDRPYGTPEEPKGVREEEYYTVGLGKYAKEKYTENAYRGERRALGEHVPHREHYTHMDENGRPISL